MRSLTEPNKHHLSLRPLILLAWIMSPLWMITGWIQRSPESVISHLATMDGSRGQVRHWFIEHWKITSWHDDVIKWKHFLRYWPFVRGIHWSPVNSPHRGQWRRALMCFLISAWINGWVNNREAGDLMRHSAHYDVIFDLKASGINIFGKILVRSIFHQHQLS